MIEFLPKGKSLHDVLTAHRHCKHPSCVRRNNHLKGAGWQVASAILVALAIVLAVNWVHYGS